MHRTLIYLSDTQYNFISEQSVNNNVSMAEIIRSLINNAMQNTTDYDNNPLFEKPKKPLKLGLKDAAKNHDKYIYDVE